MFTIAFAALFLIQADSTFKDAQAREILDRGRLARMQQDSSLAGYDAMVYERMSFGVKIGEVGRDRLLYRNERASRVQWQRSSIPVVDVIASGVGSAAANIKIGTINSVPIPYFPGRESFGFGSGFVQADVNASEIINPIARGAEQYYTYATGDSVVFNLAGSGRVSVRELVVRPRKPAWNVVIGSLWFDESSGKLVRATFRLAEPLNLKIPVNDTSVKHRWLVSLIKPLEASITAIVIEYGLHEGRFWLPRTQSLEGEAQAAFIRMPFVIEQAFRYSSVNGSSQFVDSTILASYTVKDSASAVQSSGIPPSIFNPRQDVFNSEERGEIVKRTLTFNAQPIQSSSKLKLVYGLPTTRYNKVEGVSTGIRIEKLMSAGYTGKLSFRIANADITPNADLSVGRSNGRSTRSVGLYRRLTTVSDWNVPFSLGKTLDALLAGSDDRLYYRAVGGEFVLRSGDNRFIKLFAEHHSEVRVNTNFSLLRVFDSEQRFDTNIVAERGDIIGLSIRRRVSRGLDPLGFRFLIDTRVEAAGGKFDYTRAAFDATVSRGLGHMLIGAVTGSAGTSGGTLPVQRRWYLGGAETVRGQGPTSGYGNSFWMTKAELATGRKGVRLAIFGDMGWAGPRDSWGHSGRPLSGVGTGISLLDGLLRMDVARGIYPERRWRAYSYVEARL